MPPSLTAGPIFLMIRVPRPKREIGIAFGCGLLARGCTLDAVFDVQKACS